MPPEDLIAYVARLLVTDPSAVRVTAEPSGDKIVINLFVGKSDLGRVIGEKGRTVHAIRNILLGIGARHDSRYSLVVVAPEFSVGEAISPLTTDGASFV